MLEAEWIWKTIGSFGFGALLAGGVVYLLCTRWLPGYLNKKGENLATKEDIAQITNLVKGVEHQYNVLIEEIKADQQMRMAALDKRLQAHQEAFALWRKMLIAKEDTPTVVMECQTWWDNNCLYLEPEVRRAFTNVYFNASVRQQLVAAGGEEYRETWGQMMDFPNILFKAVKLPGLSKVEEKAVSPASESTEI